jgi:hypothetical protein
METESDLPTDEEVKARYDGSTMGGPLNALRFFKHNKETVSKTIDILFAKNIQKIKVGVQHPPNTKTFLRAISLFKTFAEGRIPVVYSSMVSSMAQDNLKEAVALIPHTYFCATKDVTTREFEGGIIKPEWSNLVDSDTTFDLLVSVSKPKLIMLTLILRRRI